MVIYVFGNPDQPQDSLAISLANQLEKIDGTIQFKYIKPNQDLPFVYKKQVIIMDIIKGIDKVTLLTENQLDQLKLPPRTTAHDFDLAFQLRYLVKLGKIGKITIIGLPMQGKINIKEIYEAIRSQRLYFHQ